LYGTGDAAEKIIRELDIRGIRVSGIFASDGFVRDRSFCGYKVQSYSDAKEKFGDMTVLLCFGSHRPEVIENIVRIDSEQDLFAPDLPVAGEGLFDRSFYEAHRKDFDWARALLCDEQSLLVFDDVLEYKLSGRIKPLLECQSPQEENWSIAVKPGMSFLDLGAYTGDTVLLFEKLTGKDRGKVTAVEPEGRNFRKLTENTAGLDNIRLVNAAAADYCGSCEFTFAAGKGGALGKGKARQVSVLTADSIMDGEDVDLIKLDLEGAESAALAGAENTIRRCRPAIIAAAYHRNEDLFAIPRQVLAMCPDYKVMLRRNPGLPAWEIEYFFI